jgi:hypothetical protein
MQTGKLSLSFSKKTGSRSGTKRKKTKKSGSVAAGQPIQIWNKKTKKSCGEGQTEGATGSTTLQQGLIQR